MSKQKILTLSYLAITGLMETYDTTLYGAINESTFFTLLPMQNFIFQSYEAVPS